MVRTRHSTWLCAAILIASALALWPSDARAADIKLSTVIITLSDRQVATGLTLTNVGAKPALFHLRLSRWTQAGGQDVLEPSTELLINPPIVEIPPQAAQMVRIGYAGKRQQPAEQAFRLMLEEVPIANNAGAQAVETLLKISLPVFIEPLGNDAAPAITATARRNAGLTLANNGMRHVRIINYALLDRSGRPGPVHQGPRYVLAQSQATLALEPGDFEREPATVDLTTAGGPLKLPLARATP